MKLCTVFNWRKPIFWLLVLIGFWPLLLVICGVLFSFLALSSESLYGYINSQGQFVIRPQFYEASDFHQGEAIVGTIRHNRNICQSVSMYRINSKGEKFQLPLQGSKTCSTPRKSESPQQAFAITSKTTQIDSNKRQTTSAYQEGVAWVKVVETVDIGEHHTRYGLVDKKGNYLLPPKCDSAGDFHDGLAKCRVWVTFGVFY